VCVRVCMCEGLNGNVFGLAKRCRNLFSLQILVIFDPFGGGGKVMRIAHAGSVVWYAQKFKRALPNSGGALVAPTHAHSMCSDAHGLGGTPSVDGAPSMAGAWHAQKQNVISNHNASRLLYWHITSQSDVHL